MFRWSRRFTAVGAGKEGLEAIKKWSSSNRKKQSYALGLSGRSGGCSSLKQGTHTSHLSVVWNLAHEMCNDSFKEHFVLGNIMPTYCYKFKSQSLWASDWARVGALSKYLRPPRQSWKVCPQIQRWLRIWCQCRWNCYLSIDMIRMGDSKKIILRCRH